MSLIGTLSVSLAIAAVTTAVVVWKRRRPASHPAAPTSSFDGHEASTWTPVTESVATPLNPPDLPQPFGYKSAWLAIRGVSPEKVIEALKLNQVQESGWETGLKAAYRDWVFVSPALGDWVLVKSWALPDTGSYERENRMVPFLKDLSATLDTVVQSFASHRVVDYYHWIWAEKGQIRRAYGYLGESGFVTICEGESTPEEVALDIVYPADAEAMAPDEDDDEAEGRYPDEDNVVMLAGKWSLDPSTLGEDGVRVGTGWIGKF